MAVIQNKYRGLVIDNKDPKNLGRVKVEIPGITDNMEQNEEEGKVNYFWAYPGNFYSGGWNKDTKEILEEDSEEDSSKTVDEDGVTVEFGCCYIPRVNEWVEIFFPLAKSPHTPFYGRSIRLKSFCKDKIDINQELDDEEKLYPHKVLPECRVGKDKTKKWVIYRTPFGRTIIISDDEDDRRMEMTGRKKKYKGVNLDEKEDDIEELKKQIYDIYGNQKTVLIDERKDKEKILIADERGNYVNIRSHEDNLEINFHGDARNRIGKNYNLIVDGDGKVKIKGDTSIIIEEGDIDIEIVEGKCKMKCKDNIQLESEEDILIKSKNLKLLIEEQINIAVNKMIVDGELMVSGNITSGGTSFAQKMSAPQGDLPFMSPGPPGDPGHVDDFDEIELDDVNTEEPKYPLGKRDCEKDEEGAEEDIEGPPEDEE